MSSSEYLVFSVLVVFVLFGLGNFIAAPIIARRFYREHGFVDQGKSSLTTPTESVLLPALATSGLYRGEYKGHHGARSSGYRAGPVIEQCKAHPLNRRKFTLSKVTRRHNQARWSLTRLYSHQALPPFCLLPLSEPATLFIMMDDKGVDLSDDQVVANRYHLRTEHPELIKKLITETIREYLLVPELISIECVDNTVLIKRAWPVEKIKHKLRQELDCAVEIANTLSVQSQ